MAEVSENREPWQVSRDEHAADMTAIASALIGKTIASATVEPHMDECDGVNVLRLTMRDGSAFTIEGGYGGYTGYSCDEYVETLSVVEDA